MSFCTTKSLTNPLPNFIASEIGFITKTREFGNTGISADADGRKIIKAGTVWPTNDANATGVVFEDVDVTDGDRPGALIIAGRLYGNRLHTAPDANAVTPLTAQGLHFDTHPDFTR